MRERRPASLQLRLQGEPTLILPDGRIRALEPRAAALLALVAIEGEVSRDRAAALLWSDSASSRGALRQQLARFRRSLGHALAQGAEALALADDVLHDLDDGCGLLGDLAFEDCPAFADWLMRERRARRAVLIESLRARRTAAEAAGDSEALLRAAEALVAADPDDETHYRALMRLHAERGDMARAQAVYAQLVDVLRQRHAAVPSPETEALARALRSAAANQVGRAVPVTLLRPPRMVGRARELAALAAAWADGRSVLVLGEAGLGKSRLLAEFAQQRHVVYAQGRPGDADVPYATLVRLLRAVLERCSFTLPPPRRSELARLLPELAPDEAPQHAGQSLLLQAAVEALLAGAQVNGNALEGVIVDDLHFADAASVEMLQAVSGALHAQLRFVFAQRPGEGAAALQSLRDALAEGGLLTTITLAALDTADLAALLAALQIESLDAPALAAALASHTGGNPQFVLETLKQGWASGALQAGTLPQPASVQALLARRLAQLSPRALCLARLAAIAGPDFGVALAEHALGARAVALADAWTELQDAQVLRESSFAHDLVAEAVLRSVPEPVAREQHASVAAWLQQHDGEPARVAAHWDAAGETTQALPWLHRAAERALQALRPRETITFLTRAFDIEAALGEARDAGSPASQAFSTLTRIVHLRLLSDQESSLLPLLDRMDQMAATDPQRIVARLARADFFMHRSERLGDGLAAGQEALALAQSSGDVERLTEAQSTVAVLHMMNGQHAEAARSVEAFLPAARRSPSMADRCNMLGKAAYVYARSGRSVEAAELFDEAARQAAEIPRVAVVALANAAQVRLQLNEPQAALDRLDRSDELHGAHDALLGAGHSNAWMRMWAYQLLGRYGDALSLFDELLQDLEQRAPGKLAGVLTDRARLWLDLGQWTRALQDRERVAAATLNPVRSAGLWLLDLRLAALGLRSGTPAQPPATQHYHAVTGALLESGLPGNEAAARLAWALTESERCGYRGLQAAALARQAQLRLLAGDRATAAGLARRAVALADGHSTDDLTWPELVMHTVPALTASGAHAEAARLTAAGAQWLAQVASCLPAPLQPSLRDRHPVHRALLESARRLG
ncbi:MAG: AAA family ATPase [Burkholderiales bacterium]|jgi:DNA-binding SARP family transcriptional activator|nr:AAA family ATPase [Burkholderiales bacterium]